MCGAPKGKKGKEREVAFPPKNSQIGSREEEKKLKAPRKASHELPLLLSCMLSLRVQPIKAAPKEFAQAPAAR
jgi:hypothetical protein